MELTEIREHINRVDAELLRLFLERMDLSEQVAAYKNAHGLPILDRAREREVLAKVTEAAGNRKRYAYHLFSVLMELSRARQMELLSAPAKVKEALERGDEIFPRTAKIYGLLGRELGHSWSVPLHRAFGCPDYRLIELEPEALSAFLRRPDIGGLNVTIPYKRAVMEFCDTLSAEAREMGSVNTLVRRPDGTLWGGNTGAAGFRFMAERADVSFTGRKVVILGSGEASLSVCCVARTDGAREVVRISRTGPDNYGNLSRHADADILINATPVGMYPDNGAAPVDLRVFRNLCAVLDVVYHPCRTALLLQAESFGIPCAGGLSMLTAQAAEAETCFFNRQISRAETERVLARLSRDTENIVLIGMPGCGKSVVGKALSRLTGREAVDIDNVIEERAGKRIPEIFADGGEAAFRELERRVTMEVGKRAGVILMTGGGVVKDERNYAPLKQNGRIYHLIRDLSLLARRGRPLSLGTDLAVMEAERKPLYERFRDAVINNNGVSVKDVAAEIWRDFCLYFDVERA